MTDIHNHLLFGVDDGSISIEESISVLREMSKAGYKNVILTPHYIKDSNFNSSAKENFRRLKILREAVKENGIDIKLFLGNEIYMDDDIYELLGKGELTKVFLTAEFTSKVTSTICLTTSVLFHCGFLTNFYCLP